MKKVDSFHKKLSFAKIEISKEEEARLMRLRMNRLNDAFQLAHNQVEFHKELGVTSLCVSMCSNTLKKNIITVPLDSQDTNGRQVIYFQLSNSKKHKVDELRIAFSYIGKVICEK